MDGRRGDQADTVIDFTCVPTGHNHIATATVDSGITHKNRRTVDAHAHHRDVVAVGIDVAVADVHAAAAAAHRTALQHNSPTGAVDAITDIDTRINPIAVPRNNERAGPRQAHKTITKRNLHPVAGV